MRLEGERADQNASQRVDSRKVLGRDRLSLF